ncbi:phosphoribosylglycinamide formyltransferase [Prevotella sp.]|uniref:phosphoribosylglycinamide formyltransferase n=1 Tax=Prevotella sp. TaxID=59823 RepID=UPI003FD73A82
MKITTTIDDSKIMKKIAIFASGNGSNCENIIKHFSQSEVARVVLVVTNNPSAKVIERAKRLDTDISIVSKDSISDSSIILPLLREKSIDLIVLAGFMLFIPPFLIDNYPHRIVNIHPSLLPKYGGKGMYGMHVHEAVKKNNEKKSGITIHFVNNEYDRGEIIAQYSTPVSPDDSVEEIAEKVHKLEYAHYPSIIEKIIREED